MTVGIAAFLAGFAAFMFVYAIFAPRVPVEEKLDDPLIMPENKPVDGVFEKYLRPMIRNMLPQTPFAAQLRAGQRDKITELLIRSGNPWAITPEEFVAFRVLGAILGLGFGLLLGLMAIIPLPPMAVMAIGGLMGYIFPKYRLDKAKQARQKSAQQGLPEALDLLRITLNSGQNFVPALAEVSRRLPNGVIREELTRVSIDLRSGKTLQAALTDMARRTPSEDVESFCKAVIQTERLGSDVSDTLRQQSASARAAYEARLDKKIGGLPNLMFVPIIIFMLPALFLVILAPAFARIAEAF